MPTCRIVEEGGPGIIEMKDMQPLQIGRIDDPNSDLHGHLVWRTQLETRFEIANLSRYRKGCCWSGKSDDHCPDYKVRLLAPGEKVTLVLSND